MLDGGYIQWCNANEGRAYPIAQEASQVDDRGRNLPTDIIADMCIMVPSEYKNAYCATVRVSQDLISVSVMCALAPLLVCTVARSNYTPYTAIPMTAVADDVSGWIVLGAHQSAVTELYQFSSVAQSGLESRAIRVIDAIPVRSYARLNGDPTKVLEGLVQVLGGAGLSIKRHETDTDTLVIELDSKRAASFLGPCNAYVDAGGCKVPQICRIAGVTADENGVLTIRFAGIVE